MIYKCFDKTFVATRARSETLVPHTGIGINLNLHCKNQYLSDLANESHKTITKK